ncbi:uncharacterized protein LOC126973535 [Leptidea sinapis]|uniref:uncharacterized protein LOC126973535 n=1 Tax=Leptidea sinapis TaxID=189913 RepID=UPI0021C30E80|nr:uncharacterized protein LOC126973535 [Leptidea sinapis]
MNVTDANDFVTRLKAQDCESDIYNLEKVFDEFQTFLSILPIKDKSSFSLNVLCTLCRNLEKVPTWKSRISNKDLLRLSIECVRQMRGADCDKQGKALACIYHVHKYIVKQSSVQPELILKLSFMPFECQELLRQYNSTYWSILADRIAYIEVLKTLKMSIGKLLPRVNEHIIKLITIYEPVQFCTSLLPFLVKKLFYIYSDVAYVELNNTYRDIFNQISIYSTKIKILSEKDTKALYVKLSDCLHIITDNLSKNNFKDFNVLEDAVQVCMSLLGHLPDIHHCLLTFYLNSFCYIFKNYKDENCLENVLNNMEVSCETTKKMGYVTIMNTTYPFISQMLRICIENKRVNVTESLQSVYLDLISYLMNKLETSNQLLKCDGCSVKSGLHDSIRLSFLSKTVIEANPNTTNLPKFYKTVETQYQILAQLKSLGCVNYDKYCQKIQSATHNTAVSFNKLQKHEYSIRLFNVYLKLEFKGTDYKNISRALYNKSICEADNKMYKEALFDAFLSLVYSRDHLADKYMTLVLDIKAKALKIEDIKELQPVSVLDACEAMLQDDRYGDLKPYLTRVQFCGLLQHEYDMYAKHWPSLSPVCGVINSLANILDGKHPWIRAESRDSVKAALYRSVVAVGGVVRSLHSDPDLARLVRRVRPAATGEGPVVQAALLLLHSELELHAAAEQFCWKPSTQTLEQEEPVVQRSVLQEYEVVGDALRAVRLLAASTHLLRGSGAAGELLRLAEVSVLQLEQLGLLAPALQLATCCLTLADLAADRWRSTHWNYIDV